jgi:cytoskeletal protein RodZ
MADEEQLEIPGFDTEADAENQPERRSNRAARKRRSWILVTVIAVVMALAGGLLIVLSMQGGSASANSHPSGSASYQPAPDVKKPFGPADPSTYKDNGAKPAISGPSTVSIPSIGVATKYEAKGLLPDKVLDMPTSTAGWYNQSAPVTATEGSTVITGHVNTDTNGKGPLGGLADLQKGAPLTITDAAGTVHTFKVVSLLTVDKDKLDPAWFTRVGERRVILITCGGQIVGYNSYGLPEYTHNTVAIAVPAGI